MTETTYTEICDIVVEELLPTTSADQVKQSAGVCVFVCFDNNFLTKIPLTYNNKRTYFACWFILTLTVSSSKIDVIF